MSSVERKNFDKITKQVDQDLFSSAPASVVASLILNTLIKDNLLVKATLYLNEATARALNMDHDKAMGEVARSCELTLAYCWQRDFERGAVSEPFPERLRHLLPTAEEIDKAKARANFVP